MQRLRSRVSRVFKLVVGARYSRPAASQKRSAGKGLLPSSMRGLQANDAPGFQLGVPMCTSSRRDPHRAEVTLGEGAA
jgi:hypothetical protein